MDPQPSLIQTRPRLVGATKPAIDTTPRVERAPSPAVFTLTDVGVDYGTATAVTDITMSIAQGEITALIGPSGCGKSTLLRCLNRMNDLVPGAKVNGAIRYHDEDLYGADVDPVEVRRRIGMVFQQPNPFPKSIFDNVAFGPRLNGQRRGLDEIVEESLRKAALWDEVKDVLTRSALSLSGGQQQRLCIARAIAVSPDVLLMDEPCSALDPIATLKIEDLLRTLKETYTIVIVTHNLQQAARVSDWTAFLTVDVDEQRATRAGRLVEFDLTQQVFTQAGDPRTEDYITGRFG